MTVKKIGILTLPLVSNNGGILQAYALQYFLKKMGYEVVLINRRNEPTLLFKMNSVIKKMLKKNRSDTNLHELINRNSYKFISRYIEPQSNLIGSDLKLKKWIKLNSIDSVIVGSDQVWRLEYSGVIKMNFFLDFLKNSSIKKVSYAASFGLGTWEHNVKLTNKISSLLKSFDSVSVREKSGLKICKEKFDLTANQHVDPTLLLDKDQYVKLIELEKETKYKGDLFYFFLDKDSDKLAFANSVAEMLNFQTFSICKKNKLSSSNQSYHEEINVTKWLRAFHDAKFIITDSFHGCVFSIIFNKPFLVLGNVERGLARFESLLDLLELNDRLILNIDEFSEEKLNRPIDYQKVNSIISKERDRSQEYFTNIFLT